MSEIETDLRQNDDRLATLYTFYGSEVTTSKAIADAKRVYADTYDMDKKRLVAKKFESGWDNIRGERYRTIAVAVERRYD